VPVCQIRRRWRPQPPLASDVDPFEVYQQLSEQPTETELYRMAEATTPQIRAQSSTYEMDALARDGVVNQALAVILRRTLERAFPEERSAFEPFLHTTINRALRDAVRDQLPFVIPEGIDIPQDAAGASTFLEPDLLEVIRLLPDHVAVKCLSRNRHPELSAGLLKYIVRCLLTDKAISSNLLEKYGGLDHVGYYVNYVGVLVRWALYEIRDTLREEDGSTITR